MEAFPTAEPFRFSAGAAASRCADDTDPSDPDRLVRDTKREIQRLVQEIASLCHGRIVPRQFWPRFLASVGAAMASEGGIAWQRRDGDWQCIAHHGAIDRRLLPSAGDRQAKPQRSTCHGRMIREVGDGGGPVIVPPGAAWDADGAENSLQGDPAGDSLEPGNPTEWLAAVVPIPVDLDEPVEWMIELFLPVGGGPATQRGYLRFAAQMADLAADYLRAERLRDARARAESAARMHTAIAAWAGADSWAAAQQHLVDAAAELFGAERVSLVRRQGGKSTVVAVSDVASIDSLSPAVATIRQQAAQASATVGFTAAVRQNDSPKGAPSADPSPAMDPSAEQPPHGQLVLRGVAVLDSDGLARLVVEDLAPTEVEPAQQQEWAIFIGHAAGLLRHWERVERASWLGWIRPNRHGAGSGRIGRAALWMAGLLGLAAIGALPVPMVVKAEARLQPRIVQTVYAPRDSVVAEVAIEHGAEVQPGDVLLRLVDRELERTIDALMGRRAVLHERAAELRARLVSRGSRDADEAERLQTEQRVTVEELRSVDDEMEVLEEERQRLVLRSERAGVVDAWQVQERLRNRPVRRGQSLMRVVAPSGGWVIEADVPQNRLDQVIAAEAGRPPATVVLDAFPEKSFPGRIETLGPASRIHDGGQAMGTAMVSVDADDLPLRQAGAPATVGIRCGHRPLAYLACQDLVRAAVGTWRLYW